jgi:hypothetical protein
MKSALFAILVTITAVAQEPFTIKHDKLGESLAAYHLNNDDCPTAAFKADKASGATVCVSKDKAFTYAGARHNTKRITVLGDQVVMINLTFPHAEYITVLNSLRESFGNGTPSFTERNVLLTLVKLLVEKEITPQQLENAPARASNFKWSNGVSTVLLSEYDARDSSFQSSNLTFSLDSALKEIRNNSDKHLASLNGN